MTQQEFKAEFDKLQAMLREAKETSNFAMVEVINTRWNAMLRNYLYGGK